MLALFYYQHRASPPRLSALQNRAEDQLLAPLRRGFFLFKVNDRLRSFGWMPNDWRKQRNNATASFTSEFMPLSDEISINPTISGAR